ncbi:MAG: hypothetical protein KBS52_05285 [Clostridiales bacterium]|nr:hypothetical protein [Candidatus Equinaster intestinalis]
MENNLHAGHRAKVRKKFIENGFSKSTPPHEILEMILFYSIPRSDTNEIAHRLIEHFGSLSGVFNASIDELQKVEGMGENSAVLFKLILAAARAYNEDNSDMSSRLCTIEELGTYLISRFAGITEEEFGIVSLGSSGKFLSFDIIEKGDISAVGVSTRKVIEVLIKTRANAVVLAHNHPNGLALPSGADLTVTKTIGDALKTIGVHLADHIIVAGGDFVSLAQSENFKYLFK